MAEQLSTRQGCLGCATIITLPLIIWGIYIVAFAIQGYTYPSVEITQEPSYDKLRGKWNSYTAIDVQKTAQTDERISSLIFGVVLIGGSTGLLLFTNAATKPKNPPA